MSTSFATQSESDGFAQDWWKLVNASLPFKTSAESRARGVPKQSARALPKFFPATKRAAEGGSGRDARPPRKLGPRKLRLRAARMREGERRLEIAGVREAGGRAGVCANEARGVRCLSWKNPAGRVRLKRALINRCLAPASRPGSRRGTCAAASSKRAAGLFAHSRISARRFFTIFGGAPPSPEPLPLGWLIRWFPPIGVSGIGSLYNWTSISCMF